MSEPQPELRSQPMQLLIVDDDIKYCRLISEYLTKHDFAVSFVHDGANALQTVASKPWDAIILDVMLPGMSGYEILRKLREISNVPVLMLTALSDETDRIVGLEIGADDYLPKSFSPRELLARMRAVLRRSIKTQTASANEIVVGCVTIDLLTRKVTVEGRAVVLTAVEFDLLLVLAQTPHRIKSREQILNEIRDRTYDITDRSIDVHISSLRKKMGDDAKNPRFIRTIRSAGYMLVDSTRG
ncbi:MAG TPA: response regulator transcription factor [Drouetiella sp.]